MKKRKFPLFITLGIVLIIISLSMFVFHQVRSNVGANEIKSTLTKMESLIPEGSDGAVGEYTNPTMPILQIDGRDYVALLKVPSMQISLPIANNWNKDELFHSPARFSGSAYDNTLVIGGTDDPHQFDFCKKIENGTVVTLTDMLGVGFKYKVATVERSKTAKSEWLLDKEHHLTLYCRDTYSMEYIAVRLNLAYE